jgi:hypothetical protein
MRAALETQEFVALPQAAAESEAEDRCFTSRIGGNGEKPEAMANIAAKSFSTFSKVLFLALPPDWC